MVDSFNMDDPELAGNIQIRSSEPQKQDDNTGFRPESAQTGLTQASNNNEPMNTLDEPVSETIVSQILPSNSHFAEKRLKPDLVKTTHCAEPNKSDR